MKLSSRSDPLELKILWTKLGTGKKIPVTDCNTLAYRKGK